MATVQRTFSFATNAEGLTDQAVSAIAFAWDGADGNPAGCVKFTQGTKNVTQSERATTSGLTWASYGVPAGATVNTARVVSFWRKVAANTKLTSHTLAIRAAGLGLAADTLPTVVGGWLAGGGIAAAQSAAGATASATAELELQYDITTSGGGGSAAVDARIDQVVLEIDYTAAVADTKLVGSSAGASTTSGVVTTQIALAGSSAGTSSAVGSLTVPLLLAGSSAGASTASGALTTAIALRAAGTGAATAAGLLTTAIPLVGATAGASTAAGALTTVILLAGTSAGSSTATATMGLAGPAALAGSSLGSSSAAGSLTTQLRFVGAADGLSDASGALWTAIRLAGASVGTSSATGSLKVAGGPVVIPRAGTVRTFHVLAYGADSRVRRVHRMSGVVRWP